MPGPMSRSLPPDADSDDDFATVDRTIERYVSRLVGENEAAQAATQASLVDEQNQIAHKEHLIKQLDREIEEHREKCGQLQNVQDAARDKMRERLAKLKQRLQNTPIAGGRSPSLQPQSQQPQNLPGAPPSSTAVGSAATETPLSLRQEEDTEDDHPTSLPEGATTESPAASTWVRRSSRQRKAPRHLSSMVPWSASQAQDSFDRAESLAGHRSSASKKRKRDADGRTDPDQRTRACRSGQQGHPAHQERTIDFKDLFQAGKAKYKHWILEHPKQSDKWYILKCDDHNQHFGPRRPMVQACRHIASKLHGGLLQSRDTAVKELGIRVLNCGPAEIARNNAAFSAAVERGYQVLGEKPPRVSRRSKKNGATGPSRARRSRKVPPPILSDDGSDVSEDLGGLEELDGPGETIDSEDIADEESATQPIQSSSLPFYGDTTLEARKLYLGLKRKPANKRISPRTSQWSAIMVLPLAGSFGIKGLPESIYDTRLAKYGAPVCFDWCNKRKMIVGWAKGYEDGGLKAMKRRVPVLHFNDDNNRRGFLEGELAHLLPRHLAWLSLDSVRPFNKYDPQGKLVCGYHAALEFSKKLEARIGVIQIRGDLATGTDRQAESAIFRERRGDSRTTNERTENDQGSRPTSSIKRGVSLRPANRRAVSRSRETTGVTEEESSDGPESVSGSGDESDSGNSEYNTGTEDLPLQSDQDGASDPERRGLGLQNEPNPMAQGMADNTQTLLHISSTGGNKSVEMSYDFEQNFHNGTITIASTEPSSSERGIDNTETNGNAGILLAESGIATHAHQGAQTEIGPNIPLGGQHNPSSPQRSDSNPFEVREVLEDADDWLRPFSEEVFERSNPQRDPPPHYRPLWPPTAPQPAGPLNHEPGSSLSVGPGLLAAYSQAANRDGDTATTIAREATSLLVQRRAGESFTRPPHWRNHLWANTVMDEG